MTDEEKIEKKATVTDYLQGLFPECTVETEWDFHSTDLMFRIDEPDGQTKHQGKFSSNFLEYTKTAEVPEELNRRRFKKMLDEMGRKEVLIKS